MIGSIPPWEVLRAAGVRTIGDEARVWKAVGPVGAAHERYGALLVARRCRSFGASGRVSRPPRRGRRQGDLRSRSRTVRGSRASRSRSTSTSRTRAPRATSSSKRPDFAPRKPRVDVLLVGHARVAARARASRRAWRSTRGRRASRRSRGACELDSAARRVPAQARRAHRAGRAARAVAPDRASSPARASRARGFRCRGPR